MQALEKQTSVELLAKCEDLNRKRALELKGFFSIRIRLAASQYSINFGVSGGSTT
jgi:hypothetical protein